MTLRFCIPLCLLAALMCCSPLNHSTCGRCQRCCSSAPRWPHARTRVCAPLNLLPTLTLCPPSAVRAGAAALWRRAARLVPRIGAALPAGDSHLLFVLISQYVRALSALLLFGAALAAWLGACAVAAGGSAAAANAAACLAILFGTLFGGLLVPADELGWRWGWASALSPFQWAFEVR